MCKLSMRYIQGLDLDNRLKVIECLKNVTEDGRPILTADSITEFIDEIFRESK